MTNFVDNNGFSANFVGYLGQYDPRTLKPNDLALIQVPNLNAPVSGLSSIVAFADATSAQRFMAKAGTVTLASGTSNSGASGQFVSVGDGTFQVDLAAQDGDSGGAAVVRPSSAGPEYIAGIVSTSGASTTPGGPGAPTNFAYLDPERYDKLVDAIPAGTNFGDLAPDLIVGSDNKEVIRGSKRKADIITNGDDDVVLAGSGGGLVNTVTGENDTIFLPKAVGGADPGTTVVASPGDKTIVGGGPNDRLVVPLDRLWTKAGGAATSSSLSDNGQTVQLMGSLYNSGYETNGFTSGMWDTWDSIAGQSGSTDPLSWQDADYNLLTGYELVDGNLQIIVSARDPSQASDPVIWESHLTIVDYHTGDFGLAMKPFSDAGPPDYSNLDAYYQKVYQLRLSDDLSLTASPQDVAGVDDDPSSLWNNGHMGPFKPVDRKAIASALALVERDTDIPTGSLPPTSPGSDLNITQDDTTATLDGGAAANVTGNRDTVTGTGPGSTINFGGTGETATVSNGTVDLQAGSDAGISGDGNVVAMADRSGLTLSGNTNTVTISGTAGMVDDLGNGNSVALQGSGNTLTLEGTNAILSGAGTGNDITLQGGGDTVTTTACALTLWSDVTATVAGDHDSVYLDARDNLSVTGVAQQILLGGDGNGVDDAGTGDAFELMGNGNTLTLEGTGSTVFGTGTGNTLKLSGSGQQVTLGGGGNEVTVGGSADITAQSGDQTFVFTPSPGTTTVTGFDATDTLRFSASLFADWQSLLGHASQRGADTVIQADASHSLTLVGVPLAGLDRNHVQFA